MKVTTKGQVTIPLAIRERLRIRPGSEVEFWIEGKSVRIAPARESKGRGRQVVERLRGRGTVRMSTDEILALTRGE